MRAWLVGVAWATAGLIVVNADAQVRAPVAADADVGALTLRRVFASPDLSGAQPSELRLSPDGSLLTFLRPRADEKERSDLWARDTRTGAERMLVDSKTVGSGAALSEAEKMQRERARIGGAKGIVTYDFAPDGRSILVPIDGDLYLASLDGGVRRLTDRPGGQLNPVISPKGAFVSFVRDQNVFVQPLDGRAARALTTAGGGTVHFGEAEFVAQEEMDRRTGYWWSPDERYVAVERFDEAPVHVATRASIGATGTKTYDQRYPAAGTPNVLVELHVMRPDGSGQVKVDLGADPDIYLARVDWTPDGTTLLVQRQSRDQKTLDMLAVDPTTGRSHVLFTERAPAKSWLHLSDSYRPLGDGSLIWRSERDGYGHLYRWRPDGRWTQLTEGPWVVTGLVGVDERAGRLYFMANKDDVLEQHLYAVDLARPKIVTRLTEAGWTHAATMDAAASRFIVRRSNPAQPTQVYLADTSGTRVAWINENAIRPGHPYHPFVASHRPTQFGTIRAADGSVLHWEMITPPLEPGKRYPVFFQHYGGPGSQTVTRGWQGALPQWLVDQGYIFFQIDNRGSPNRGRAFENQIYHAIGTVEVADQKAGADYLKTLPFVDPARIATYGWSYGGYLSLKMLEKTPGVYAAAVAGAPVTDWQLYDTHYTERYLGDPAKDPQGYAESAAVTDASKIREPLLLIHGMADDNVFFDNSTRFAATMQGSDTPFEMMFYPGQTHRVGGPGISEHLWRTILDFLDRNVKNAPAPAAAH
ncbi:S9 family peptidase [Sphingomonas sp. MA1305]|uniref:S9 family peptidase n=1 Tax=Sphingomonas sp. MA1305 TaxID=2479204 RepID=UPI0018DF0685|nr:DPP IV N-terminal domain-containing protein [Sphingomonas sp. MA1305]MBI0475054.1 S9 family peptidase [Sphingomonas sp. MA1305]